MAYYHYQSISRNGRKKKGSIEASSLAEAKDMLREKGILLLSIREQQKRRRFFKTKTCCRMHSEQLANFTSQLSQLLSAGIPLYESLLSLAEQSCQESYSPLLSSLCGQIKKGTLLSAAMSHFPDTFSTIYCSLVSAGESVGSLDLSLKRLAELLAKQNRFKKQMLTSLFYPSVLACFSFFMILTLLTCVIPSLKLVFEGQHVNRFTQSVFFLSDCLTQQWMYYFPCLLLFLTFAICFLRTDSGRQLKQNLILKLPLLGGLHIQSAIARFSRTMGSLLQGGIPIIHALQIARSVMHSPPLETHIKQAEQKIIEGSMLSRELSSCKWIPKLVTRMLAIGEESGSTPQILLKIAELYEAEVEKTLSRLTVLAQPVILIVMGGIVGLIMLAVLLPMTDINAFI